MTCETVSRRAAIVLACAAAGLAGCQSPAKVEAWEKGDLAKPDMTFDADRLRAAAADHVYTSKEAGFSGRGVGGGGCGCN